MSDLVRILMTREVVLQQAQESNFRYNIHVKNR